MLSKNIGNWDNKGQIVTISQIVKQASQLQLNIQPSGETIGAFIRQLLLKAELQPPPSASWACKHMDLAICLLGRELTNFQAKQVPAELLECCRSVFSKNIHEVQASEVTVWRFEQLGQLALSITKVDSFLTKQLGSCCILFIDYYSTNFVREARDEKEKDRLVKWLTKVALPSQTNRSVIKTALSLLESLVSDKDKLCYHYLSINQDNSSWRKHCQGISLVLIKIVDYLNERRESSTAIEEEAVKKFLLEALTLPMSLFPLPFLPRQWNRVALPALWEVVLKATTGLPMIMLADIVKRMQPVDVCNWLSQKQVISALCALARENQMIVRGIYMLMDTILQWDQQLGQLKECLYESASIMLMELAESYAIVNKQYAQNKSRNLLERCHTRKHQ